MGLNDSEETDSMMTKEKKKSNIFLYVILLIIICIIKGLELTLVYENPPSWRCQF